jgi:single-stranded-DNA-specific exonuclease
MTEEIANACKKAAQVLLSFPAGTRVRVVSHYDADGIAAAGVLCKMLVRAGFDFHATLMRNPFTKGFDRLRNERNELIIFSDMGSGQLEEIASLGCQAIILDHHQYLDEKTPSSIIQINANLLGSDGNYEVSGATLCYMLANAVDQRNEDLVVLALAGAVGDKQYIGGIRGLNKTILDNAIQKGFLKEKTSMKLCGDTLADALFYSVEPYFSGLSGNASAIEASLKKLHLKASVKPEDVDSESLVKLQSFLLFRLIKTGCPQNILDVTIRKRYYDAKEGWELERFADLLDACGKNGYRSLGLSLCLDHAQSWTEALAVEREYKQKLLDGLQALEKDGAHETDGMRYFYTENSSLGGVIAGIATNFLFDEKKPLFSLARKETDDEVHVSCRGNQALVASGLDLGVAMKTVATALGGFGGGHKIAAGATIAFNKEEEFLEKVDELLVRQMKGEA